MGIYAQTNFEITCDTPKVAKQVLKTLKELKEDENGNTFGRELEADGDMVYGFEDSPRIQNLEYRLTEIWQKIKDIKGVKDFFAPLMSEGDTISFTNEF